MKRIFKQVYHSLFDPANITVEEYRVRTLTRDKLEMEILLILSVFGPLTPIKKYLFTHLCLLLKKSSFYENGL